MSVRQRILVVIAMLASLAAGDTVITSTEVIPCTVVRADTLYTRLKLPTGSIRMLMTQDIYEIRLVDPGRIEPFTTKLPGVRVLHDSSQVIPPPEIRAEEMGIPTTEVLQPATVRDPVAGGGYMFGGGASYIATEGSSSLGLTPTVAYFVTRGVALGGDLTVNLLSVGGYTSTTVAIGPKATFALGPRASSVFFVGELGLAVASFGSDATGTRTTFAVGFLPVILGHIGIPIKLFLLVDDMGAASITTWQFGVSLLGMVGPTETAAQGSN